MENPLVKISEHRTIDTLVGIMLMFTLSCVRAEPFAYRGEIPQRDLRFQRQFLREMPRPERTKEEEFSPAQHQERLSIEERRQLRRDIKDAGREIYPPRP